MGEYASEGDARMKQQLKAALRQQFVAGLQAAHQNGLPLPGVQNPVRRDVFVQQLIDSVRRVQYASVVAARPIDPARADGLSALFDPIRAALLKRAAGDFDEACWLVFLFVHFGKHARSGYRYTREVYSALGQRPLWTFLEVSNDVPGLRAWLNQNEAHLRRGKHRGFGNHRKYLSLSGTKPKGTGSAFATYAEWVAAKGGHAGLFADAMASANGSPEAAFDLLYHSMSSVVSFGRIGKFDYLTMLQKLGFLAIKPGSPYLDGPNDGPTKGARLMLQGPQTMSVAALDQRVRTLGQFLTVGMQEMEDSLCNWQKSPHHYVLFGG